MSDHIVQPYHDSDATAQKSVHPYQSAWMTHWMRTSCKSAPQVHTNLSLHYEDKEDDHDAKQRPFPSGLEIAPDISKSVKGFREVTEARTVKTLNESLTIDTKNLRNEKLDCQPFPMFNLSRNRENTLAPKNDQSAISHRGVLRSQLDHSSGYNTIALGTSESHFRSVLAWAPPETETPTKECHFQPEGISRNPDQQAKSHKFLEKKSLAVSRSFRNDFLGSTSKIVPYGFNSERMPIQSFMCRQEEINQSSSVSTSKEHFTNPDLTHLEHEHFNYDSYSAFLVRKKKMDSHLNSEKSGTSLLRQNDGALLLHDPSTSKNQLPVFVGEQCQKLQNRSGIVLFPSQSSPPEVTKSQRMPCSVHDVETMRICTTVDAVKGLPGSPSKFSQTTHRWLITKKTDVNLSKVGQIFRESTASTNVEGNTFSKLLSLSPDFGFHGQQGVKLQPLGSSTGSEGKENTGDVKTSAVRLKNESSAETDTMDMDAFQENHLSGATSSPSNTEIMGGKNSPTSQATTTSAREEVGGSLPNTKLPDINQELPALPAAATSMHDGEPSTSRTQSLDVEHLLSHAEPTSSKPCPLPGGPLGPEPSSRWVKRLKLSTSDSFAHGTKSSKMGETSSHEKVNKFFSKIMNCSRTSSEPTLGKRYGKEPMAPDKTAMLLINGESSSTDSVKKDQDITVPLSWIRRWCRNRAVAPQKKPEAEVVCEPQSSNAALDELQKKQFPSIAAMALMGKAVSGFRPCEFRKKGSFVVWNTKGF